MHLKASVSHARSQPHWSESIQKRQEILGVVMTMETMEVATWEIHVVSLLASDPYRSSLTAMAPAIVIVTVCKLQS